MAQSPKVVPLDGRRARVQRGREAVLDAMLDLVVEGHGQPTATDVAERAGVSTASVFRYFDTLGDLEQQMAARYFQAHAALFDLDREGEGPLPQRIDRLVKARVRLYATIAPLARVGRSRAVDNDALDAELRRSRRGLADQVRRHFAAELAPLRPVERDDLAATLSATVSIEAWDHLRLIHDRTDTQIARAWKKALRSLLTPTA